MAENKSIKGSIFNIGDLAKPVATLIQRTSDFIGAALAPRQLVRMAKAKVEAERLEKLGNAEIEIQERALKRLLSEEIRNQKNIEKVVLKALPEVKEDAKPEEISDDWFTLFFEKCKRISDDEMQNLWAKILADEANELGTFSLKTVEFISTLKKADIIPILGKIKSNKSLAKLSPVDLEAEIERAVKHIENTRRLSKKDTAEIEELKIETRNLIADIKVG